MKSIPHNMIRIKAKLDGDFFRYWFEFLEPFHKLTNREIDIITAFVKERYRLSKLVSDNDLLDKVLMSEDTRRKIREECNINLAHFQVILSKFKKQGIIIDDKINPKYIPLVTQDVEDEGSFRLLLVFEL